MLHRKLGITLIFVSVLVGVILFNLVSTFEAEADRLGCYQDANCSVVEDNLNVTHFITGVVGFILALGVYLSFFYKGEEELLSRINAAEERLSDDETFNVICSVLDDAAVQALTIARREGTVSQKYLTKHIDYSKAKVSETLSRLEDLNLIEKEKKGRSNTIHYVEKRNIEEYAEKTKKNL